MRYATRTTAGCARLALAAGAACIVASAGLVPPGVASAAAVRNPEDLLIVDCLLPGQVRKLGRVSQFITARRPIRTTQADCEIRGGEYVSYDRANYQTALQVWMAQAEQGDAEAQNYVGEIYSKGLGTAPDYGKAASWFEKSRAQGNKRAMINLGYLYEEGLGVGRDLGRALALYREASGAKDALLFASTVTAQAEAAQAEISSLQQTVAQQREEQAALRGEIDELRGELDQRRRALDSSRRELEEARAKVVEKQAAIAPPAQSAELKSLADKLGSRERTLATERATLEQDKSAWAAKLEADRAKLAALKAEETELSTKAAAGGAEAEAAKQSLERVRGQAAELALALDDAFGKMEALEKKLADNEKWVADENARFEAERKKMQDQLAASQQDRELLLLLEQQLGEKQKEVVRQREQIVNLQQQVAGGASAASTGVVLAGNPGPMLEILEPALTVTRGKPAASVRGAQSEIVGKVVARGGLKQVVVNGTPVTVDAAGVFRAAVPVAQQGSNVQVAAVDASGRRAALEFTLMASPTGGRAVAQAAPPPGAKTLPRGVELGKYYAVVIGNNQYGQYPALASASNDAQKIANLLKSRYGFETRLLVNANRFEILSALNDMREQLTAGDNLVLYFAGHGEIDAQAKQGYWLPVDAQPNQSQTWISNRAISDILNTMAAKHVLVVADSCYSGAMTRASVPTFANTLTAAQWGEWVKNTAQSRSRTALTSGGLAPVPDAGGSGTSLFARAFIAVLEDNNQLLEAQKLFRGVSASLALAATESALIQIPEYAPIQFAGHEAGEFFFWPKGGGARNAAP